MAPVEGRLIALGLGYVAALAANAACAASGPTVRADGRIGSLRIDVTNAQAARREGKRLVPGCRDGLYLHVRWDDGHQFALTVSHGRVRSIAYLGPHSVYDDGLC